MKTTDTYASLLGGVSQQVPFARNPGQHYAQVNMLPDPVRGLVRRQGSVRRSTAPAAGLYSGTMRTHPHRHSGVDYLIHYPTDATAHFAGTVVGTATTMTVVSDPTDTALAPMLADGVSAITSVGKFIMFAGRASTVSASIQTLWSENGQGTDNPAAGTAALWVRGGAYGRTMKVTVTLASGAVHTVEHELPSAAYSGVLDTTKVPVFVPDPAGGTEETTEAISLTGSLEWPLLYGAWSPATLVIKAGGATWTNTHPADPTGAGQYKWAAGAATVTFHEDARAAADLGSLSAKYTHAKVLANGAYTATVAALTFAHSTAETAHIIAAAKAITPAAIAEALADKLAAVVPGTVWDGGSHVTIPQVAAISADDGGDGSLLIGVANDITDTQDVTKRHIVGKVVRVRPDKDVDGFYLEATPLNAGDSGMADVIWVEGTARKITLTGGVGLGQCVGNTLYLASSPAILGALTGTEVPAFVPSTAGDASTVPLPYFVDKRIDYLGMFQDRLLVGSGGVIRASRVGDYLNFFRRTVLSALADDACEMQAEDSEGDTLSKSVLYERNLVLMGERQYIINGQTPLTPTNAVMPVMGQHSQSGYTNPAAVGGVVFYARPGPEGLSVQQLMPGAYAESTESYGLNDHCPSFVPARPLELFALASPSMLILRDTEGGRLYVYQYIDGPQGRVQGAWYALEYAAECGTLFSAWPHDSGILLMFKRGAEVVIDWQSLSTKPTYLYPHLDSCAPYGSTGTHGAYGSGNARGAGAAVADLGPLIAEFGTTGLYVGFMHTATATLTEPYAPLQSGRGDPTADVVVGMYLVSVRESAGMVWSCAGASGIEYPEAIIGAPSSAVELASRTYKLDVGAENTEAALTLSARSWLPLSVSSVAWTGQIFKRTQGLS